MYLREGVLLTSRAGVGNLRVGKYGREFGRDHDLIVDLQTDVGSDSCFIVVGEMGVTMA